VWTAAILAGGQGRRLGGRDKSALQVGDRSILARQIEILRPLAAHLLIIGSHAAEEHVRVVEDRLPGNGALGGLYTALIEAPTDQVLVIACDMPFISAPLLQALATAGEEVDVALPRDGRGRHPLCASYHRRIAPQLRRAIDAGALRIADALDGLQVRELGPDELEPFNRDGKLLFNVNTPDDYQTARSLA
jgi:molybdopterin-guanine dinucleotide biosynthesis protein A